MYRTCRLINLAHFADQTLKLSYKKQPITVKPFFSGHSKIDKTKVLKTNGSLMKVESITECSLGAFYNTFDLY